MSDNAPFDPAIYDWQPCSLLFPRFGKLLTRDGVRTRLILPGSYLFRRSRTFGSWIYRHRHES